MKTLLAPLLAIALAGMALGAPEEQTPRKRPSDPDTRIWDWSGDKVTVIYRDPSENEKSSAELADESYINFPEDISSDRYKLDLPPEQRIFFSVLLDKNGEAVCIIPGTTAPAHPRDCLTHIDAINQLSIDELDPNTPGIEDIHDLPAAFIQMYLNSLALEEPGALEAPSQTQQFKKSGGEHEAYEAEVEAELAAEGVQMKKRHNKPKGH
ncbi:hypothetical protein MVEG_12144 [Podila verticillata NRRL 6337]|uniref:Uncharacterized protein n=1 Tax=Podila verticillata NRRL 6337 TaxID=1069443 RepID=A0A086TJ63_9FUNG|nr:hypothetical protein MVEG_12144 [Podila verticillata NRRL 6337]